jgi:hypothetical protein
MAQAYFWNIDANNDPDPVLGSAITNLSSFTATPQDGKDIGNLIGIVIVGDKSNTIKTIKVTVDGLYYLLVMSSKISGKNVIIDYVIIDYEKGWDPPTSSPIITPELRIPKEDDVSLAIYVNSAKQTTVSIDITYISESQSMSLSTWAQSSQSNHNLWLKMSIGGVLLLVFTVALIYWYETKKSAKTLGYRGKNKSRFHLLR